MSFKRWVALLLAAAMLLSMLPAATATPSTSGCRASANGQHKWNLVDTSEATCTEPGYRFYMCEYCQVRQRETIDPLGHKWAQRGDIDYTTCTGPMYVPYVCTRCGDTKVEERSGPGHNWVETGRTGGDCTNGGAVYYRCSRCGETKTERLSPNGKHDWGKWKTDEKATCTKKGLEVRTCKVCGKEEWRFTDMLEHEWGDWQTDTATGAQVRLCKNCGAKDTGEPRVLPEHWDDMNPQVTASSRVAADAGQGKKYAGAQVPCDLVFTNTGSVPVYITFDAQEIWDAIQKGSDPPPNGVTTVKNPLALGKTTGALLNPGEKLSWPYVAEVDTDAAAAGFLSFGFNAAFLYEDADGVMKSASSTMGFVGVVLTSSSAPVTKQNPAVTASGRWAEDAGAGKRFEGAEVAYEYVFTNTGDTPVYIFYDNSDIWTSIQNGNNPPPHGLETIKSPFYAGNTTAARLDPGECVSQPVTDTVEKSNVDMGVYMLNFHSPFAYYDLEGIIQAGDSSVGQVKIPLTAEANVSKPEGYDTVDLTVTAVMTSPVQAAYAVGDTLTFLVTLTNNSSFTMDAPSLRADTLYETGWEYQTGVDIRGYNGQTMGTPKLAPGATFTVEDKYVVRQVDLDRNSITIAWRGFGYPDAAAMPNLPPEWSDPMQRPASVQWDDGQNKPLYFRSGSEEITIYTGSAGPVYDTEKLALEMQIVGGEKSAYAVAETVYFEALLTNEGTVRYGTTNLHFSYGDADSGAEFADLDESYGDSLLPAESWSAMSSYTFTPADEARGYVDLRVDGYAVYTDAHWPSFPPEEEHIVDFTGAEPVTIRLNVGEPAETGLALTAYVVSGDSSFQLDDQVAIFVAVTNTGKEPLRNPCAFINGLSCMARNTVLEPGYTVTDTVFVKVTPEYLVGGNEEFLVEAAAWPTDSAGALGMPWKGGVSALSDDAVFASPVLIAVPVEETEGSALTLTVTLTSESKDTYFADDVAAFSIILENSGKTVLEVPTILIDYTDDGGVDLHMNGMSDLGPGEQLAASFSYTFTTEDADSGKIVITFGSQAWEAGAFDGTLDDYSYSEGAVQSSQTAFILDVGEEPGPIPGPEGEPVLTLYAEPKLPKAGYYLDEYNQTEEIPYLLTVANDGDAPFEFGELTISIGGVLATVDPGLGIIYPSDIVEYTLTGTRLVLGDIIPGTDMPGILGIAEVTFLYNGHRIGDDTVLWSNDATVENVILEGDPEPIPETGTVWVFKTEISAPEVADGYAENEVIRYKIIVVNMTGRTLDEVSVHDILSNTGTDGTLIDTILNMGPDESRSYVFDYVVTDFDADWGYVKNKAYAEWTDPDTGDECRSYSENVYSSTIDKQPEGGLTLTKFVDTVPPNGQGFFEVGDEITFRVEIDNSGDTDLMNVFIYDLLIPEEEMGHCLAGYSVIPAGGHETATFTYTVQDSDLIPGCVVNSAFGHGMDGVGNMVEAVSNEVSVDVGRSGPIFTVVEPLEVIKEVVSTPGDGRYYYKVGETIEYKITVKNPDPVAEYYNIDVYDILSTDPDQKIGHIDYLGPNSQEPVSFSYKVQDSDLPVHSVGNQARIGYDLTNAVKLFNQTRVTIDSNWVYSRVDEKKPDPPTRREPLPGDCCELTLTAHGSYALDYTQHFCADHAAVKARADAAVLRTGTEAEKLAGWQTAQDIWREELDKMYVKCMNQASGKEKAAVMDERAVFYLYLNSLEETLKLRYPDQPAKAAEIVTGLMRDRCAEMCYLLHKAPGARRDSLSSGRYTLMPGTVPAAVSARSEATNGKKELLIHLMLDAGLGRIEESLQTANSQASTRAQHTQAFVNARALWRTAADQAFNALYQNGDEAMRQALGLNRLLMDQLLAKREALLNILYPSQPDIVAEQISTLLRDYAVMLAE